MTTNLPTTSATKILIQAREILERDGWCQGHYRNPRQQHCLVGAVRSAISSRSPLYLAVCNFLRAAIGEASAELIDAPLIHWNDQEGRTAEQAFAAIDKAVSLSIGVPQ